MNKLLRNISQQRDFLQYSDILFTPTHNIFSFQLLALMEEYYLNQKIT